MDRIPQLFSFKFEFKFFLLVEIIRNLNAIYSLSSLFSLHIRISIIILRKKTLKRRIDKLYNLTELKERKRALEIERCLNQRHHRLRTAIQQQQQQLYHTLITTTTIKKNKKQKQQLIIESILFFIEQNRSRIEQNKIGQRKKNEEIIYLIPLLDFSQQQKK